MGLADDNRCKLQDIKALIEINYDKHDEPAYMIIEKIRDLIKNE
jgi:hypothetical protein